MPDVKFTIWAKDKVSATTSRIGKGFRAMGTAAKRAGSVIKGAFGLIKKAIIPLIAGVGFLAASIKQAFDFEATTAQFKVLFGSLILAKKHVKELQDFSASTPFQFKDIAEASKKLEILTGGLLNTVKWLKLTGDAAAATGQEISEVSNWVGRAYSAIQGGQPFGEAAMRLLEMGVVTTDVIKEMQDLKKAGKSNAEVWAVLEKRLGFFNGGMEELSKTGKGVFSTLKDNVSLAMAEIGNAFLETTKGGMLALTTKIKELRSSGKLAEWAATANEKLIELKDAAIAVLAPIAAIGKALFAGGGARSAGLEVLKLTIVNAFEQGAILAYDGIVNAFKEVTSWDWKKILKGAHDMSLPQVSRKIMETGLRATGILPDKPDPKDKPREKTATQIELDAATARMDAAIKKEAAAAKKRKYDRDYNPNLNEEITAQAKAEVEAEAERAKALKMIKDAKDKIDKDKAAADKKKEKEDKKKEKEDKKKEAKIEKIEGKKKAQEDKVRDKKERIQNIGEKIRDAKAAAAAAKAAREGMEETEFARRGKTYEQKRAERLETRKRTSALSRFATDAARAEEYRQKHGSIPRHMQRALDWQKQQDIEDKKLAKAQKLQKLKDKFELENHENIKKIREFQEKLLTFK